MRLRSTIVLLAVSALALLPAMSARAEDLAGVLAKLDSAAKDFHTTSASVEFDTVQTDPIPDTDVITGDAYYDRKGNSFQMAAHFHQHNGRPTAKDLYLFQRRFQGFRHWEGKRC